MAWQTVTCLLVGLLLMVAARIPGVAAPVTELVQDVLAADYDFAGLALQLGDRLGERLDGLGGLGGLDGLEPAEVVPVLAGGLPAEGTSPPLEGEGSTGVTSPPPEFIKPVSGRVVSWFGWRIGADGKPEYHPGVDVRVDTGTVVRAAAAGVVAKAGDAGDASGPGGPGDAGDAGGPGRYVILDHGGGWTTLYARNTSLLVAPGQPVARGEAIAMAGQGDGDTGPYVHLEVRSNGQEKDPAVHFGLVDAD